MAVLTLSYSEYLAFAQFTFSATTYSIGTQDEVRSGVQYLGVIKSAPLLEMDFATPAEDITYATNIDLVIGDAAGGTFRTLVDGNILDGMLVTVTLVNRFHWNDLTVTETTYSQQMTVVGSGVAPGLVTLHLQDLENGKLDAVYPLNLWQASDFSGISSDDAGKAICEPVGTAIKLPAALLLADTANNEYWYGVCAGTPKTYAIGAVNTAAKQFEVAGDVTATLVVGGTLLVNGSTANDGAYTIASFVLTGGNTFVVVTQTVPSSTANGSLYVMPMPLTVYRNKRIVALAEYAQVIGYAPWTIVNGNFASGGTGWNTAITGTGTSITFTGGTCTLVSVNSSNNAYIGQTATGGATKKGGFYAVQVTVGSGADAIIGKNGPPQVGGAGRRLPAGATTTVFIDSNISGADAFAIGVWNYAGTAVIDNVRIIPMNLTLLKFALPQIDFNGTPYVIEADVNGVESRNCSGEIQRLLGLAGVSTDATSFTAAKAASFTQNLDSDYGRAGQRKFSAIISDLLYIARAGLSRNASGAYTIWQDAPGSPTLTLDESLGDPVQVDKYDTAGRAASVGITYAPSSSDPNTMQVPLSRPVVGGVLGAEQLRELRYLRDATTADQLVCYLALRRQYCRIANATLYRTQSNIGDIISLTSPRNWVGPRSFIAWGIQRVVSGNKMTLMEYNAAVYTYTAIATLPANAPTGYQPDYSFTPPVAPTALTITAGSTRIANDGTTTAYVTCSVTPPTVNWQQIWFAVVHNVTGELTLAAGASIGGGNYGVTIGPLRPGEVYKLQCYAVNSNNVSGVVQSTFNATAIGGGGAVTTFTTPGNATAPPTVASCTASQTMGSYVLVGWPAVVATNLQGYAVEMKIGVGAFTQVWVGNALTYQFAQPTYGVVYQFRVRALDTYGNFSAAYATSGTVTPAGNVSGGTSGDIGSNTVATPNRTNTSTASVSWNNTTLTRSIAPSFSITHSLGRIPLCGALNSGSSGVVAGVSSVSSSSISGTFFCWMNGWSWNLSTGAYTGAGTFASCTMPSYSGSASIDVW